MEQYPRTFTLIPDAMAHKINLDAKGMATSVNYIDKKTGKDREIKARTVVVACGTLESTRLILQSKIANSSGRVGRNFIEHLDVAAQA
jgi:choline dehydrogenase-like flavoprotein